MSGNQGAFRREVLVHPGCQRLDEDLVRPASRGV